MLQPTLTQPRDERNAWCLWGLLFLTIAIGILTGRTSTVTLQYATASNHWLRGDNLYRSDGHGFLYLPQAAILFIPFTMLPSALSEIAWRIVTVGFFAAGVFRLCRMAETESDVRLFPLVTCVTIPLAWSAARNGQATLIIAGLMMLAASELSRENWRRAAILLSIGLAYKPLILVLILLVGGIYRPMLGRLLVGIGAVIAIPYVTGDWHYATGQYIAFAGMLGAAVHEGTYHTWAHLFGLLQTVGIEVSGPVQTVIRIVAALLTLLAGWLAHRRLPASRCSQYLFALAGCYLMLFNPRTENNTYSLVAPAIGLLCAEAFLAQRNPALGWVLLVLASGIVGSYEIGRRLVPAANPVWLAPLMCVGFTALLLGQLIRELHRHAAPSTRGSTPVSSYLPHLLGG